MPNSAFPPRDGLLHGPSAAAEDVTGSASSELKFSAGFDAEWDKGQLLKGERVGLRARSLLLPPKPEGVRAAWGSWLALGTGNPSPGLYAAFWGTSPGASAEGCLLAKCWHQNHVLEAAQQGDTPREPDHQGSTRGLEQRALKITRGWDGMGMGQDRMRRHTSACFPLNPVPGMPGSRSVCFPGTGGSGPGTVSPLKCLIAVPGAAWKGGGNSGESLLSLGLS